MLPPPTPMTMPSATPAAALRRRRHRRRRRAHSCSVGCGSPPSLGRPSCSTSCPRERRRHPCCSRLRAEKASTRPRARAAARSLADRGEDAHALEWFGLNQEVHGHVAEGVGFTDGGREASTRCVGCGRRKRRRCGGSLYFYRAHPAAIHRAAPPAGGSRVARQRESLRGRRRLRRTSLRALSKHTSNSSPWRSRYRSQWACARRWPLLPSRKLLPARARPRRRASTRH